MNRLWPVAKWCLIAWGILCTAAAIFIAAYLAYQIGPGNRPASDLASPRDVRFVLNWCGLGEDRIEEVLHSYASARSFTGDHLDAHAIRISHIDIEELTRDESGRGWHRCDQAEGVLKDTLDFVMGWLKNDEIPWFLSADEIGSDQVYVSPWSIYLAGTRPTATKLIFIRPSDKTVFYISCKM